MPGPALHVIPYNDIAALIGQRLADSRKGTDALAPWSEEVVVASGGVSQAIVASLLERIPSGMAALRLGTIEALSQRILTDAGDYPRVASDAERRLAMRTAARSMSDPMTETRGAAAMLERSYRDVRDTGLSVADFARRVKPASSLRNHERLRTVIRVWEEYERLIVRLGVLDPAELLGRAAERIRSGAPVAPQILAGFYDLTGAQKNVIRALQDVEKLSTVFIPVDGHSTFALPLIKHFSGTAVEDRQSCLSNVVKQWTVNEYRTREDEIRGVASSIAGLLDNGVSPQRVGIVARSLDPYDLHLLERFAGQSGFAISSGSATPLLAHRFGRAVSMLVRLRERDYPRADVLEIARSGLKTKTSINAEKADFETRKAMIAGGRGGPIRERTGNNFTLGDYASLVEELEVLTERIDATFASRIAYLLRIENDLDLEALQAIESIGDLFVRSQRWNRPFDPSALIDALSEVILDQHPTTNNRQPQIWAGDVMRLRGRSFDRLFVIRMQDDLLPQRRTEDPLLPDSDRRQLQLREIGNGRDEEQLLFSLMRGTDATHFSFASSDGFGKPLRPSQFLKAFAMEADPAEKPQILKNFTRFAATRTLPADPPTSYQLPATSYRSLQLLTLAGTKSLFDGYITSPLLRERAVAAIQSISPTQLEDFGECPQKFLMKHILHVVDIDDPEREVQINHREKGSLDHRVLERFFRATPPAEIHAAVSDLPRLPARLRERLEQVIDAEFDKLEEKIPPFNRSMRAIERRATKRVLHDFVAADIAKLIALGLTPSHFEYRFGTKHKHHVPDHPEPFVLDTGGLALRVEGTIDRIDTGGGRYRIVDYKSGKAGRHQKLGDKIDRGVRLQLALYAMAVADFFAVDASSVSGAIKPLVRGDADPAEFAFELAGKEQRLRQTLALFVDAIAGGMFPAYPNESDKDFNSCKYCPVRHSCRTKHDAEEQRAVLQSADPRTMLEGRA
ncbi:MAG: PD-(D/E)XK nuclease family protein [Thermoanaerobaculia bacterium]